jgi:hypothetical protein
VRRPRGPAVCCRIASAVSAPAPLPPASSSQGHAAGTGARSGIPRICATGRPLPPQSRCSATPGAAASHPRRPRRRLRVPHPRGISMAGITYREAAAVRHRGNHRGTVVHDLLAVHDPAEVTGTLTGHRRTAITGCCPIRPASPAPSTRRSPRRTLAPRSAGPATPIQSAARPNRRPKLPGCVTAGLLPVVRRWDAFEALRAKRCPEVKVKSRAAPAGSGSRGAAASCR